MVQPVWTGEMPLPEGWYVLQDGRRFYGMGPADLREFCQKAWERQAAIDRHIAGVLFEFGPVGGVGPKVSSSPVPVFQDDLFVA